MSNKTLPLDPDELRWVTKERIVDGLRYTVAGSALVLAWRSKTASGFWRYVFRTPGGRFFLLAQKYNYPWSPHAHEYIGHTGEIEPISQEYAVELWQRSASADRLEFELAFPSYVVQEA